MDEWAALPWGIVGWVIVIAAVGYACWWLYDKIASIAYGIQDGIEYWRNPRPNHPRPASVWASVRKEVGWWLR